MLSNHALVGCYIDNAVPRSESEVTDTLLDLLVTVGGTRTTFDGGIDWEIAFDENREYEYTEYMRDVQHEIEAKINEYLPDGLIATWIDGDFLIVPESEME